MVDRRNLADLDDEELVREYQETKSDKIRDAIWNELVGNRYLDSLKGWFDEQWSGVPDPEDLFRDTFVLAKERDILQRWDPDRKRRLSVKNWIFIHFIKWLPRETEYYKRWKKRKTREVPIGDVQVINHDPTKNWEKEARDLRKFILTHPDSPLSSPRCRYQKKVLEVLWENYRLKKSISNQAKAEELGMSKDSFAKRKERAFKKVAEVVRRRGKPAEILLYFNRVGYSKDIIQKGVNEVIGKGWR